MWESRAVGEIPKESWEEWESRFWISILSTLRHFHGSPAAASRFVFPPFHRPAETERFRSRFDDVSPVRYAVQQRFA